MNKKILIGLIVGLISIFIVINIVLHIQNKPPEVKFRLTVFPLKHSATVEKNWVGDALWETINKNLQLAVNKQAVVIPADYLSNIVNVDSLNDLSYIQRYNDQISGEYALLGEIEDNSTNKISYRLFRTMDQVQLSQGTVEVKPEQIVELGYEITNAVLKYFDFSMEEPRPEIQFIPGQSYLSYLKAKEALLRGDYSAAQQFAEQSIKSDNSWADGYLMAGKCWFMKAVELKKKGESPVEPFEKAFELLSQAAALDSSRGEIFAYLGEYYIYRERWSRAEQMLAKAYKLDPQFPRLYLSLSRLHQFRYRKLGFKDEKELFTRAIFLNPCYADAYLMLSDYYLFDNKREDAIRVLEQYLKINPNSVPVLMALGKIYLVRNDILKIIDVFNRVIELAPNNSDAYYNLGILYYNSEDYDNAEKFFKRAIAIDNHLNSHLYLAYLYEIQGDMEKAIYHLRMRIRYRKGLDDVFAEEARKRLYDLMHHDNSDVNE